MRISIKYRKFGGVENSRHRPFCSRAALPAAGSAEQLPNRGEGSGGSVAGPPAGQRCPPETAHKTIRKNNKTMSALLSPLTAISPSPSTGVTVKRRN